jgi:uncharacterized membrane protein YdjX (TVP38/TMEM64 family)
MNFSIKVACGGLSLKRLFPIALIASGFAGFFLLGGQKYLSFSMLSEHFEGIMAWYEANTALTIFLFCIIYAGAVGLSLPGAVWLTLIGGFIFGTWGALVLVVTSATVGSVLIFLAARYAFADFFHAKAGPIVHRMEDGFRENALSYLLFLRLVPVFPFWLVNLVPAVLGVPLRTYIFGTLVGIIPGSFVYCSVGNGLGAIFEKGEMPDLGVIFEPQVLVPIIGLAVLSLIPIICKRIKKT